MSWNNNGPWGPSGKPNNPWAGKKPPDNGGSGSGGGPSDPLPPPFDLDTFLRKWAEGFRRWHTHLGGPPQTIALILAILATLWILSGFYQVGTDQVGVVMRFGAFDRIDAPGLRYHLPYPVETALLPNVTAQNQILIGFQHNPDSDDMINVPEESMMLTQDENIIDVQFAVFWRIGDIQKFLFEIRDPEQTIKMAAESAMREVIGQNKLQFALTDGREQIADQARERLQKIMDDYNAGVIISQINLQTVSVPDEVRAAFQDVVNARLDQERFQNEAETHVNNVIPQAKGDAARIVQQAMGYRDQEIALAQGEADRFTEVLAAYNVARDVTARRLYLETMEAVLENAHKVILDKPASGAVPYLPLQDLLHTKAPLPAVAAPAPAAPAEGGAK